MVINIWFVYAAGIIRTETQLYVLFASNQEQDKTTLISISTTLIT